jgi:FAD/FMN-containing dehydrogenase
MITNINYPRNEESIAKAHAFSKRCHEVLFENGFLPYRSGAGMFDEIPKPPFANQAWLKGIKNITDSQNILAPGKYHIG